MYSSLKMSSELIEIIKSIILINSLSIFLNSLNTLYNTIWSRSCWKVCFEITFISMSIYADHCIQCGNTAKTYFFVWSSTRVPNELGAGNSQKARIAVHAPMFLAVTETAIVSSTLFASSHVFGYLFSNEKEIVDYVTSMSPLVCLSVILDSIQGVLCGNVFPSTSQIKPWSCSNRQYSL